MKRFLAITVLCISAIAIATTQSLALDATLKNIEGDVAVNTDGSWSSVDSTMSVGPGDKVRTDDGRVRLTIPGEAVTTLTEQTLVEIIELDERTENTGLVLQGDTVTVTTVDYEVVRGDVLNAVKNREESRTNYELKTPNAVAGIRGTTFECGATRNRTDCSVLEGEVRLRSVGGEQTTLRAGERGTARADGVASSSMDEATRRRLERFSEDARQDLQKGPDVSVGLLNRDINNTIRYDTPAELVLRGAVEPGEKGVSLQSMTITVNETTINRKSVPSDWQFPFTGPSLEPGGSQDVTVSVSVTDSNDKTTTVTKTISLARPDAVAGNQTSDDDTSLVQTDGTTGSTSPVCSLPDDYMEKPLGLSAQSILGFTPESGQVFYRPDLDNGNIVIDGQVDDPNIEAVLFRVNDGEWRCADGASSWTATFSPVSEFTVDVVALSVGGNHSPIRELGEFTYRSVSYPTALRDIFDEMWRGFENENADRFVEPLSSDFQLENSEQTLSRTQLEELLADQFDEWRNLQVDHQVDRLQGDRDGGEIKARVAWTGERPAPPNVLGRENFVARASGDFRFNRTLGFEVFTLKGFRPVFFDERDNEQMKAQEYWRLYELDHMIDARMLYDPMDTTTDPHLGVLDASVTAGGITKLSVSSMDALRELPRPDSGEYVEHRAVSEGGIYGFVYQDWLNEKWVSAVMKVTELTGTYVEFDIYRQYGDKANEVLRYHPE